MAKESSVSFFVMILGLAVNRARVPGRSRLRWRELTILVWPFVVVLGLYLTLRASIVEGQPLLGTNIYQFHLGVNLIRNSIMLLSVALVPVSSVAVVSFFLENALVSVILVAVATVALIGFIMYCLIRARSTRVVSLMAMFALIGAFPMAALNHVSELYAYNSLPFVSVIVGIALGRACRRDGRTPDLRRAGIAIACLVAAGHIVAAQSKIACMRDNGRRATRLIEQVAAYADQVPRNGRLVLLNTIDPKREYSVFRVTGFNLLRHALPYLQRRAGREDMSIFIIDQSDLNPEFLTDETVVLSLSDGRLGLQDYGL